MKVGDNSIEGLKLRIKVEMNSIPKKKKKKMKMKLEYYFHFQYSYYILMNRKFSSTILIYIKIGSTTTIIFTHYVQSKFVLNILLKYLYIYIYIFKLTINKYGK